MNNTSNNVPFLAKGIAVWLISNTCLTFEQIADFCHLHILEIEGLADEDVSADLVGCDPITTGDLTREEIKRCEKDPQAKLQINQEVEQFYSLVKKNKKKVNRYTPIARRQDRISAIAWILKTCPFLPDSKLSKLIGTTKTTIESVRNKTHRHMSRIRPRDPVLLGLCRQTELDNIIEKYGVDGEIAKQRSENLANNADAFDIVKNVIND